MDMHFTKRTLVLATCLGVLVIMALIGLSRSRSGPPVDPRIVKADNEFAFKLFREVMKTDAGQNVFISPASIALALHMTYDGARGKTKDAMAKTLGLQGMTLGEINRANAELLSSLENPGPKVQLYIANSLWANAGSPVKASFVRCGKSFYHAEVASLDFSSPGAASRINSWIAGQTRGEIRQMISGFAHPSGIALVNAMYFKGVWTTRFDKSETKDAEFWLSDSKSEMVPMMRRKGKLRYCYGNDFAIVRMPYGKGRLSMYVLLPGRQSSLKEMLGELDAATLRKRMSYMRTADVYVQIPGFKTECRVDLKPALSRLGMGRAFDRHRADLSGALPPPDGWLSEACHRTRIEVDEDGTKAQAVTFFHLAARGGPPPFIADRPFAYLIRDDKTGMILFMGQIVDPKPD